MRLEFNIRRLTSTWLAEQGLGGFDPDRLRDPDNRDKLAEAWAQRSAMSSRTS